MVRTTFAAALFVLAIVRPIRAEECHECTRAGNYGVRPVSIGLITSQPVLPNKMGPKLVAPANYPSSSVAQTVRMNDSQVRLASNEFDAPKPTPKLRVNDVITVVKKECCASAGNCDKSECESCWKECELPARIAVEVAEVLPNGTLAIKGHTTTMHSGQVCEQSLTGEISPQSITPDLCVQQQDVSKLRIRVRICKPDADRDVLPVSALEDIHDEASYPAAARSTLLQEKEAELASLQEEVDRLRGEWARTQQILVKIQMLEVSLTKLQKMGFEFSVPSESFSANSLSDIQNVIGSSPLPFSKSPAGASKGMIEWLCENSIAKELASPQIVTISGRPAQFCVGNEIPIPGRGGAAASGFQQVGTKVDLLACALGEDRVRLEIRARISDVDESRSFRVGDSVVPAFSVRECDTAIESKFDQSTVLCGGIESRTESVRKFSDDGSSRVVDQNNEIALLVIVTPEAVAPVKTANRAEVTTK